MSVRCFAFLLPLLPFAAAAQTTPVPCTGLCLQQVQCPNGGSTTISGTVYAPNGIDPIPNVTVYIPNAKVAAMPTGVSCPIPGAAPSGSPLVGTYSAFDGTFTLTNVPVGPNIPVVIVAGKWRKQTTVNVASGCTNTPLNVSFPRNQSEGDIPRFAISTGRADQVECVLRKVGIDDTEFSNGGGTGRIQLYQAADSNRGARLDVNTPSADTLMGDSSNLNSYDVLMLPCEGAQTTEPAAQLGNLVSYANAGGRVYGSHFAYSWMYRNPPFDSVATWLPGTNSLTDGPATVNQNFSSGATLAKWLQLTGASTTLGQIAVSQAKRNVSSVSASTQTWLTLNDTNNDVMQFTWDTPVGANGQQCGRVLFNEYHVENPPIVGNTTQSPRDLPFPTECPTAAMTPQEKLLEYSLFDLSNTGGPATIDPPNHDFGSQAVGSQTAPQPFTITNNSVFVGDLGAAPFTSGDFLVLPGNTCRSVPSHSTCTVNVVFKPTALGARAGSLSVLFAGTTLTATLTGTGVPPVVADASSLDFGNVDVGSSATKPLRLTNVSPGPVDMPGLLFTGDYKAVTNCPSTIPVGASCLVSITFAPTATGARPGSVAITNSPSVALTGNGIDFALKLTPASDTVVAGLSLTPTLSASGIAGFSSPVTFTCTTDAPSATCTIADTTLTLNSSTRVNTRVTVTTTSQYKLAGYGTDSLWLGLAVGASGLLIFSTRRRSRLRTHFIVGMLALTAATAALTGCSGKIPAQNPAYTPAGMYTVTVSGTDGIITRSATFSMQVKRS